MSALPLLALTAVPAYLLGAVPFGYLVGRARGVDILRQGSGNIGATNVGRVLGRRWGVAVFLLDFAKGALPVLAAASLAPRESVVAPEALEVTAGLAAFVGHLFPAYLGFRGGKGVATGAGVVAVLTPLPAVAAVIAWLAVFAATRYVSVASLTAAAVLCAVRLATAPDPWAGPHATVSGFCLAAAALVLVRHRANVARLLHGTENRFRETPTVSTLGKTLHVLALGLWFGMGVFFTFVVGFMVFGAFEAVAELSADRRPNWFPEAKLYAGQPPSPKFPDPLRKEQGSRAAGVAVGAVFGWYYGLQVACGAVAAVTALGWWSRGGTHRLRAAVLLAALALAAAGWGVERVVEGLRAPRNERTDIAVQISPPDPTLIREAEEARAAFGMWHGISVLMNLATLGLVTVGMALAARLPADPPAEGELPFTKPG
jgi:acyl-phosphate glycerol 3-phosphate acyltransferase